MTVSEPWDGLPTAVIGLDLSLTSTGFATPTHTAVIRPKNLDGLDRIRWITDQISVRIVNACTNGQHCPAVAVEGPSFGSTGSRQHERAGLWWYVVEALDRAGWPVAVVPPTVLKRFATGRGNADKDAVLLAVARRFEWFSGDNNEADALTLAAIAAELIGQAIVEMPLAHRRDLASKVTWVREPVA